MRSRRVPSQPLRALGLALVVTLLVPLVAGAQPAPNDQTEIAPAPPELCALLDVPEKRGLMDGLLLNLIYSCGREADFLGVGGVQGPLPEAPTATDVNVNDPSNDVGHPSITQSETSIIENPVTGTLCAGYNDSCEFFCPGGGGGFTGFSRSTDGGATWDDRGALSPSSFGDPSIVWRQADGDFYFATLNSGGGLGLWTSTDDCQTFNFVGNPASGGDDKELIAVDNNPASPHFGNLYLVWTDFGAGGQIRAIRSTNGGVSWSPPDNLAGGIVQGAWPTVAPNGDVYVAWLRYSNFISGPITIDVARSTDGGLSYSNVTSPLVNAVSPRDNAATGACGRPALRGNIRYLASPQIVADDNGDLHIVYSYDPDGFNNGDVSNVYYRKSTDNGASWGPEIQLNDDATTRDQYFPTLFVDGSTVMASWYDRRLDPGNLLQDTFKATSTDGGASFGANVRVSDVSSPIVLDPNLAVCYHGDYDQTLLSTSGSEIVQWADDRDGNPNVFTDTEAGGGGLCEDIDMFQARCNPAGTVQVRVKFVDNSHDGETVTIGVDGTPHVRTIFGNVASYQELNAGAGPHTVTLDDPAGCFDPIMVNCPVAASDGDTP